MGVQHLDGEEVYRIFFFVIAFSLKWSRDDADSYLALHSS